MKVVLAQITPALGDLDGNLDLHLDQIRRATKKGADLIVFPELSLTGYLLQDLVADCAQDPATSHHLHQLASASRRIAVAVGFVEQGAGVSFFNSAALFLGGSMIHVHRKVYLPTYGMFDEARYFGAGDVFRTCAAPWGRTGILICEDFWHLSSSYILAQEGMEVLLVMSSSPTKGIDASPRPASRTAWLSLGQVVAQFLTCFVVYVNRAGYEDGWNFSGGSFVVGPSGKLLAEGRLFKDDSVTVSLEDNELRKIRTTYPVMRDEKLDLVRRELERIAASRYRTG